MFYLYMKISPKLGLLSLDLEQAPSTQLSSLSSRFFLSTKMAEMSCQETQNTW